MEVPSESSTYAVAPDEDFVYNFSANYPNITNFGTHSQPTSFVFFFSFSPPNQIQ